MLTISGRISSRSEKASSCSVNPDPRHAADNAACKQRAADPCSGTLVARTSRLPIIAVRVLKS
jgi:hypothetical protein